MAQILSNEARERLARIQLVRPQKAQGISDLLLRMAQSGQLRGKVSEDQLVGILDQVEAMEKNKSAGPQKGAIKVGLPASYMQGQAHLVCSSAGGKVQTVMRTMMTLGQATGQGGHRSVQLLMTSS